MSELFDCRQSFAETLEEIMAAEPRIVVVTNDSVGSSRVGVIRRRFAERVINVGIAEQNMVGVSAGLANGGKIPFICGASCFLTGRALEQVKVDIGYSKSNVKLCGMSSGLAYGALGATHHSIEDLAWTRVIPELTVIVPADPVETGQAVRAIAGIDGPVFLRLSRMPVPVVHTAEYRFQIGRAAVLRDGEDVALIATGTLVSRALAAAELLAGHGMSARVVNMSTIRPIDRKAIVNAAKSTRAIVTMEEHSIHGGLGSAVAEVVVTTQPVPMRMVGIPGVFAPTGSAPWLFNHFGMTPEGICTVALDLLNKRVSNAK
jgi:transketolase